MDEINSYFKSIAEQDRNQIVICDLSHTILYMNPSAIQTYEKKGGKALIGSDLLKCHNEKSAEMIKKTVLWFRESAEHNIIHTFYNQKKNTDIYMVALRDDKGGLIGYYEKHECRTRDSESFYNF